MTGPYGCRPYQIITVSRDLRSGPSRDNRCRHRHPVILSPRRPDGLSHPREVRIDVLDAQRLPPPPPPRAALRLPSPPPRPPPPPPPPARAAPPRRYITQSATFCAR